MRVHRNGHGLMVLIHQFLGHALLHDIFRLCC